MILAYSTYYTKTPTLQSSISQQPSQWTWYCLKTLSYGFSDSDFAEPNFIANVVTYAYEQATVSVVKLVPGFFADRPNPWACRVDFLHLEQ